MNVFQIVVKISYLPDESLNSTSEINKKINFKKLVKCNGNPRSGFKQGDCMV